MTKLAITLGVLLMLLGIGAYFSTGQQSITAMIPAFFGLPIVILGIVALNENRRRHAMHGVMLLALLGFLGSFMGLPKLVSLLGGAEVARPAAVIVQSIMAILCAALLGLGIKSFIDARRGSTA